MSANQQEASSYAMRAAWLIGGLFLFRLAYAAWTPLDLVHDEAYYWDWSRQLDWGYYSKPPMVAWLIGLATALGGSTPLVVRLPAVVLATASLAMMYLFATRMYGPRAGFWALLLAAATPGSAGMALLMTIDAPLMFCWGATLYGFWRVLEHGPHRRRWIAATAVSLGLGLLSKETMLAFFPLAGLFLLVSAEDRRELLRPAFWLCALGGLLFLLPVLWWNVEHGWITWQHSSSHFAAQSVGLGRRLARSGEFLGSLFGVFSPLTCGLCGAVAGGAMLAFPRLDRRERFLLCFSGVPMLGVLALSLARRVEPNWPAPFCATSIVLLAGWASGHVHAPVQWLNRAVAMRWAASVGVACTGLAYFLPIGLSLAGLQGGKFDPTVRLRGWREMGLQVGRRLDTLPQPDAALVIVTGGRAMASELAFYMPQQPRVYLWNRTGDVGSQYDLWGGPREQQGRTALIVTPEHEEVPPRLAVEFSRVEPVDTVTVPIGGQHRLACRLWRGLDFRQWPARYRE